MNIKTTVQTIFQYINKYTIYVLLSIIGILLFLYSIEKGGNNNLKNNLIVSKDSVTYYKNKSNELYAKVNTYVITEKQLKELNGDLYNEVHKYKNQKPIVIVKEKIKISYKDTIIKSDIYLSLDKNGNKQFNIIWKADTIFNKDNYIKLSGSSYVKIDSVLNVLQYGSKLNNLEFAANLFLGVNEDKNGKLVINARTDFPGLTFPYMEGYIIDPMKTSAFKKLSKRKRYGLSAFGGVGTYFDGGIKFIPTIGVGITYDFFKF